MNGDDKEEDDRPPKMYKGVTKDQWQMVSRDIRTFFTLFTQSHLNNSQAWSFVTTVKPDLSDYDADGVRFCHSQCFLLS